MVLNQLESINLQRWLPGYLGHFLAIFRRFFANVPVKVVKNLEKTCKTHPCPPATSSLTISNGLVLEPLFNMQTRANKLKSRGHKLAHSFILPIQPGQDICDVSRSFLEFDIWQKNCFFVNISSLLISRFFQFLGRQDTQYRQLSAFTKLWLFLPLSGPHTHFSPRPYKVYKKTVQKL